MMVDPAAPNSSDGQPSAADDAPTPPATTAGEAQSRHGILRWTVAAAITALLLVWGANEVFLAGPVRRALRDDTRNTSFTLRAHYAYYVNPTTVVFNLTRVQDVAPVDLFRALFQATGAVAQSGQHPTRIVLARAGRPVFHMLGDQAVEIGSAFTASENPVYLIRTLPEKLYEIDGRAAYQTWTGGMLGVLSRQMEDATDAARRWAAGAE